MLDLPPSHIVESFLPITMWIAPAGTTDFDFTSLKYPTPAIGGLFYGVSSGSGWGGLPTRIQKTKIYNLETRK